MPTPNDSAKARSIILQLLSRGLWYAPHEIHREVRMMGVDLSPDSTSARTRELRSPRYGHHTVSRRRRAGTDYFEYQIKDQREQEAA
jgi:hypothetical protein